MDRETRLQSRRTNKVRNFPHNTCPASRHVHMMADALAKGKRYHMFEEEPEHCAVSLLSVLESLWRLRTETEWPNEKDRKRFEKEMKRLRSAKKAGLAGGEDDDR